MIFPLNQRLKAAEDSGRGVSITQKECKNFIQLRAENVLLREALVKIQDWQRAYPLKVFPEPDLEKAHKVLKAAGMTLDAISASNMRHVINGIKDIVDEALAGKESDGDKLASQS